MPWLEERTLTLFVRDTEVRRYEPGVRERGVDVERPSGPLMGSADTDTDTDPDRALTLKAPVIHGHLIRQHFLQTQCHLCWHLSKDRSLSIGAHSSPACHAIHKPALESAPVYGNRNDHSRHRRRRCFESPATRSVKSRRGCGCVIERVTEARRASNQRPSRAVRDRASD